MYPIRLKFAASSFLIATLTLSAYPSFAQPLEADKLFEKISPSVWVIHTFDGNEKPLSRGSAVVTGVGTLITNCHVLAKAKSFVVKRDNVVYGAALEHADVERDLCQIAVKNFAAPVAQLLPTNSLRVGQKVYAVGNPRGLELTFSDGLISGLRKSPDEKSIELVQTSAPISPGSSGGGLFDAQGRLVGITTATLKESQNLNFAMPADWIAEVPVRSNAAIAKKVANETAATATGQTVARKGVYFAGQTWEYLLTDRQSANKKTVQLRVDRFDGDQVVFNGNTRVESAQGRVVRAEGAVLGELDAANIVNGWLPVTDALQTGSSWSMDFEIPGRLNPEGLKLTASVLGDSTITVPAGVFETKHIQYKGFRNGYIRVGQRFGTQYEANVWFAPSIGRIVKFTVYTPGVDAKLDEMVELARYEK
jgi:serine protease Do